MRKMCFMLMILMAAGSVMAGTISASPDAPTGVFVSGVPDPTSFTRIFANGARPTDGNEGRGNEILPGSSSYAGYTMDALVIRKDAAQDFTNSTATLTLYIFEGTKEQWDLGDGQADGDLWDGTGITTIYEDTFALTGNYAEGDYITLALAAPIIMGSQMNWFIKMDQGNSANTYFQIAQLNSTGGDIYGYQYQAPNAGHLYTNSPLEYYAVGVNNNVATNVSPTGDAVNPATETAITWGPPVNYTPEVGYDLIVRIADPNQNEPNFLANDNIIEILDATASSPESIALQYGSTYWCQVTAYEPNGVANNASDDIPHSLVWSFTTILADTLPVVTVSNYITWPDFLPLGISGTVVDNGEGDIDSVTWDIIAGPGFPVAADMRMVNYTSGLFNILANQDLFRDWIGTDCSNGAATSDVLNLTLSGLPAGSYTWTSYHYDAMNEVGIGGVFDVTVTDSTGSTATADVPQYTGPVTPVPFTAAITSDGSDVTLQFVGSDDDLGRFMMNAFELTGTGDPLYIDFGTAGSPVQAGYQAFTATDGVPASFVDPNGVGFKFDAFGTQVTVTPDWDAPGLEVTSTGGTVMAPTATVNTTDAPKVYGPYTIEVTATEDTLDGNTPQTGSATMIVQVAEDTCAAAQLKPGFEFDTADIDQNCVVDLLDLATLGAQWLNDLALTEPATY